MRDLLQNSGNWSQADPISLSPNVTAVLAEDFFQQCADLAGEEITELWGNCEYSEEDLAKLEELVANVNLRFPCFLELLQESCQDFVEEKVLEALYSALVPLNGQN